MVISVGTKLKFNVHPMDYFCAKFHTFIQKCTIFHLSCCTNIVYNANRTDSNSAPVEEPISEDNISDKIILSWKDMHNSDILKALPNYVEHLPAKEGKELSNLLHNYSSICSDEPGSCTLVQHDVVLEPNTQPIRQSYYRVSYHLLPALKAEVNYLLEHNLAKPSTSPWASPCILVKKPNNKFRMCRLS